MAFSPDGKRIAYGFADVFLQPDRVQLFLKISDIETGVETLSIKTDHDGTIMNVAFSGDGKRLISTDNNGEIKLWEAP